MGCRGFGTVDRMRLPSPAAKMTTQVGRFTPLSLAVPRYDVRVNHIAYDEFAYFAENLAEWGLDLPLPEVRRRSLAVDGERQLSALLWGEAPYEALFVHGGAQNAHTFDTVALALQRSLIAVDLPSHGHSDAGPYGPTAISQHANDLATATAALLDGPRVLVGMSLGGLTSLLLAHRHPELVSALVLVDITPGVTSGKARHITDFVNGPKSFPDFDALLARTAEFNPTRTLSSLRRGILHNAIQVEDGSWVWRHQRHAASPLTAPAVENLWEILEQLTMPVTLLRGMAAGSVVDDLDEVEFLRHQPTGTVIHVDGAGHSIQGDAPVVMAEILAAVISKK